MSVAGVRVVEFGTYAAEVPTYREEKPTLVQGNNFLNSNDEHLS